MMNKLQIAKEILILSAADLIVATAVFFFLIPSHASVSSISGLAIVLVHFLPFSVAQITMVLNVVLLIIGFLLFGREFGLKTVYTSIMLPVFLFLFEQLFPHNASLTGDAFLDVTAYICCVSIGLAILFNRNASSGGLDIVAKILNRYLHMELGQALAMSGMCIALSSALAYDSKTVLLSILGTYFNGIILDHFIFGQTVKKRVCIITKEEEKLRDFILRELHSGATIYEAIGAYDLTPRRELITIVDRQEFRRLMDFLGRLDSKAFVTVYTVTEMHYQPKPRF